MNETRVTMFDTAFGILTPTLGCTKVRFNFVFTWFFANKGDADKLEYVFDHLHDTYKLFDLIQRFVNLRKLILKERFKFLTAEFSCLSPCRGL